MWSSARVGSVRLDDVHLPSGDPVSTIRDDLAAGVLRRAFDIVQRKGYTNQAWPWPWPASCAASAGTRSSCWWSPAGLEPGTASPMSSSACPASWAGRGFERQLVVSLTADEQVRPGRSATILDAAYRAVVSG